MSYIIQDNKLIAETSEHYTSGNCYIGYITVAEALNANRDENLVNREIAKISNAKKWRKLNSARGWLNSARKLRNDAQCKTAPEFLISEEPMYE